jgi:hypothetical protein
MLAEKIKKNIIFSTYHKPGIRTRGAQDLLSEKGNAFPSDLQGKQ